MFTNLIHKIKLWSNKKEKIKGSNNVVNIDKNIISNVKINGFNNYIDITGLEKPIGGPLNIEINIKGNHNKIIIKNLQSAKLFIDIGNYTGVDNVEVEILDNFVCAQASILAYQNNVPIKIGKNCLFSNTITIRSGELPHVVYDINTLENFDKSDGVFIGDHVWIGEHAYIMKNAKIPDNSIVAAMSVVTKPFSTPNVLIAGNPAKIRKENIGWNAK